MPGSGKSTIGVVLAKLLCYQFVDMDIVIQEQEKKLLREIIADVGNEGFMEIENRVNAGFYAEHSNCPWWERNLWKRGNGAFKGNWCCNLFKAEL